MRQHYFLLPKLLFYRGLNHMDIAVFVFLRHSEEFLQEKKDAFLAAINK